jgi:hypothetical protein
MRYASYIQLMKVGNKPIICLPAGGVHQGEPAGASPSGEQPDDPREHVVKVVRECGSSSVDCLAGCDAEDDVPGAGGGSDQAVDFVRFRRDSHSS